MGVLLMLLSPCQKFNISTFDLDWFFRFIGNMRSSNFAIHKMITPNTFRAVFNWVSKVIRQLRLVLVLVLLQFEVS